MTQLSTAPAGSCETAAASANFPMLESARTCAEPAKPSSYFTLDAKKKKWFKVLRAVQYNIRGRVIYRLFSHARVAC